METCILLCIYIEGEKPCSRIRLTLLASKVFHTYITLRERGKPCSQARFFILRYMYREGGKPCSYTYEYIYIYIYIETLLARKVFNTYTHIYIDASKVNLVCD